MKNKKTIQKLQPNVTMFYLPVITFSSTIVLIMINWCIYHFNHNIVTKLLLLTGIFVVGFLIIFINQLVNKKLLSYLRSLVLTQQIHQMLKIPKESNDYTGKPEINVVANIYNAYLRQSYAEYENNKLYIWIRIPNNISAQKLLDERLNNLRESIDNYDNNYSFSNFERKGNYYLRVETK